MKDNKNSNINYNNIYVDDNNDSDGNDNIFNKNIAKDDSLEKYFKPMEDNHETDDILKQLENLNLSEEKSFDMPQKVFEPLANKKANEIKTNIEPLSNSAKKRNPNIKEQINNGEEIDDNNKELKMENANDNNKQNIDEMLSNGEENEKLSEFLLREKLNRICASIQGYTLNQKCYQNMNNFIPFLSEISQNLYQPLDRLFDVFIELLCRIKQEFNVKENLIHKLNDISLNNEGYEKKLLKLKKEIKEKEKEIGALINKVNFEKEKTSNNSKSKILEINSLKKENQQLNNKLTLYKNQLRKSEADYKAVENKLRYYIFERENKNNMTSSCEKNNKDKSQEEFKINNEKYLAIKKLNMNLVYLLKDINKNICKYDFSLNKIINNNGIKNNYEIDDLNNNIETNLLIDENNFKTLCKNFMFNMDIINSKIIDILKQKNDVNDINDFKFKNNNTINNTYMNKNRKDTNKYKNDKSVDNINDNKSNILRDNSNDDNYNKNNYLKERFNSINNNKINLQKNINNINNNNNNNNSFNNRIIQNNNTNNPEANYNKVGRNIKNVVNTKYEYHSQNYNKNVSVKNDRKKNSLNFLNFYNNDDKDLEDNIETRAIDPKWYENCKNKKVGYVFDKNKLFTCNDEEDRTNGGNRK